MAIRPHIDVRKIREAKALSQEMLATIAGVSVRSVRRMENGEQVSAETYRCIAAALDVTTADDRRPLEAGASGATATMDLEAAIPLAPTLSMGSLVRSGTGLMGASAVAWACWFNVHWFRRMDEIAIIGIALFCVAATMLALQSTNPTRKAAIGLGAVVILAFEVMALRAEVYHVARIAHAIAFAYGGAALAGLAYSAAMGTKSLARALLGLTTSGALAALAVAPLSNLAADIINARVQVERAIHLYSARMETLRAKPDATMLDKWKSERRFYEDMYESALGPPKAIKADMFDYGLFERRRTALEACWKLPKAEQRPCLGDINDRHPSPMVAIGFSHLEIIGELYATPSDYFGGWDRRKRLFPKAGESAKPS